MPITAYDNAGFDGPVDEVEWASLAGYMGAEYAVRGVGDLKVTAVAGVDRTVQVQAGDAFGHGVLSRFPTATIQLPNPGTGTRWHLLAVRRDWQPPNGTAVVDYLPGSTTRAIPGRQNEPGVVDDQPIALVQVSADSTTPTAIVDLRVWAGNGGMRAADELALKYLARNGASVHIGSDVWLCEPDSVGALVFRKRGLTSLPLLGAGSGVLGDPRIPRRVIGEPQAYLDFKVQGGSIAQRTDLSGYGRVNFPVPFPNGVLTVLPVLGDGVANPDVYVVLGFTPGAATYELGSFVYQVRSLATRALLGDYNHRLNWLAIGF